MALLLLGMLGTCWTAALRAQDMSTIALLQPRSGCALSPSEVVQIRVINYGPTLPGATIFSYAYSINAGTPVIETVFMGNPVPPNGTITYTFNTRADLSLPAVYWVDATVTVSGDANPDNNALGAQSVQNWAPSVGGVLNPPASVASAGALTLDGQLGDVLEWQQSVDGQRWRALQNHTTEQGFAGLAESTQFRVQVQNGPCPPALSSIARAAPDFLFADGFEP